MAWKTFFWILAMSNFELETFKNRLYDDQRYRAKQHANQLPETTQRLKDSGILTISLFNFSKKHHLKYWLMINLLQISTIKYKVYKVIKLIFYIIKYYFNATKRDNNTFQMSCFFYILQHSHANCPNEIACGRLYWKYHIIFQKLWKCVRGGELSAALDISLIRLMVTGEKYSFLSFFLRAVDTREMSCQWQRNLSAKWKLQNKVSQ